MDHRVWKRYETLFVDGEDFNEIGTAFENACPIHKASLGNGTIRLMKQRDLVDFAVRWIEENRQIGKNAANFSLRDGNCSVFSV